ncbi:AAA family ATPase [Thiomicrospira microaerophila]|uniref:ExeA family protein n=1 Tax=Thiomicrospira microaerophila TaxID=406020 RepID=UPI0020107EA7|nr:AAA family ATPase [Thiomicrospira microaerophila]UQB43030.1 AAA family ATPase [Thiomicrospira microaerophila]
MYESFFNLNDLPFRSTPDLEFFYSDASRGDIVDALVYSLKRGDGVIKVVGEVGSGKTTILRKLVQCLPLNFNVIYINSPNLLPSDILFFICHEFGLEVSTNDHRFAFINQLQHFFISEHGMGRHCLILVDEAQAMPIDTLEEMRLLSNLETDQHKLVQIVLFGQPELDLNLSKPEIRQFLSRVSQSIYLPALNPADVFSYLNFRMRKAGYSGNDVFSFPIAKLICKKSNGMIREIHSIADSALLAAYCDDSKKVMPHHLSPSQTKSFIRKHAAFLSLILVFPVLIIGLFAYYNTYFVGEGKSIPSVLKEFNHLEFQQDSFIENVSVSEDLLIADKDIVHDFNQLKNNNVVELAADNPSIDSFEQLFNSFMYNSDLDEYNRYMRDLFALLDGLNDHKYSIQIITGGVSDLNRVVSELESVLDSQYLYWSIDFPRYILFYGIYSDFSAAQADIDKLPSAYKIGSPIVVRASSVKNRLKNNLSSIGMTNAQ